MPGNTPYHPSELVRAFDDAWTVIQSTGRDLKPLQESQLRFELAKCIIIVAENGVTDPDELRRRAIEEMLLTVS